MAQSFLLRVCESLRAHRVRYAIVGGHAVAFHGAVRGTLDVDIALNWSPPVLARAEEALTKLGLVSRLPVTATDVFKYRDEYVRNRNLVAWNFYNPKDQSEQVNLLVTYDLTGRDLKKLDIGGNTVTILNRQDLVSMKTESGRPQDIQDVEALEKLK